MQMRGNLLLLTAAFLWGTTFVAQQVGMDELGPFTYAAARFMLGILFLLGLWHMDSPKRRSRIKRGLHHSGWLAGLGSGVFLFAASSLQQVALQFTSVGKTSFITALYIVLVPLGAALFRLGKVYAVNWLGALLSVCGLYFLTIQLSTAGVATILQDLAPVMILVVSCLTGHRKPKVRELIAIFLALAGVTLITTHGDLTPAVSIYALLTGILSAFCVTIYNVVPGRLMKQYPVLLLQGWAFLMGSIVIGLIFHPWTYHYVPSAMGLFGIAFVVLVGNVLAFPCYMLGVKIIGPEKGVLYGFAEPLTAALIATFLLHSPFTIWDALGFAAVFGMLVLISIKEKDA